MFKSETIRAGKGSTKFRQEGLMFMNSEGRLAQFQPCATINDAKLASCNVFFMVSLGTLKNAD